MQPEATIGIDIGGTNTKIGVVGSGGNILAQGGMSTEAYRGRSLESFLEDLHGEAEKLLSQAGSPKLLGIGIGAPNGNYYRGSIEYAPNLPWHGRHPLVEMFGQHFQVPICLTNDAKAAALGEMVYGAAKGMKNFIVITLGTGVGSGIVINGQLVYGHGGFAGELGHNTIVPDGRPCTCGRKGCLESYCSARGIRQTAVELLEASDAPTSMRTHMGEKFSTVHIAEAAQQGDPIALEVFERTGRYLAMELSNAIGFSEPEAIFLFGGIMRSGDLLLEPVRRHTEERLLCIYREKVRILPSAFEGDEAAILGASALIVSEMTNTRSANSAPAIIH